MPYNAVGDKLTCRITGRNTFVGRINGPIKADDRIRYPLWEAAWYNGTTTCIKITKVQVEYMDGSSYTYVRELPKILDSQHFNKCK